MIRVGTGYDSHRFDASRRLFLGGIEIPGHAGLAGHSDADALIHAVCDALLGASGLGDMGAHFPDSDPRHKDRPSSEFLKEVRAMLEQEGLRIVNIDITVVTETPKLAAHRERIRSNLAELLGMEPRLVNLKAKTNEGMGFVGRGEGIAVLAAALVEDSV